MKLIRGLHALHQAARHSIASIGNFDGVHLGHQQLLQQLKQFAQAACTSTTVILFEPQPAEYFLAEQAPARLLRLHDKLSLLNAAGIDQVVCLKFNATVAGLSANEFIKTVLLDGLAIQHLVIGDDFRFGKNREGDQQLLAKAPFAVTNSPSFCLHNKRVSSTAIRQLLSTGELNTAQELLGYRYFISGHVIHGDKRGRTIGFPTANLRLPFHKLVLTGVYAVNVIGLANQPLPGVANIGWRPTVDGITPRLEVHLLNFSQDIYGRFVRIEFLQKIRDEKKFTSLDALVQQITHDVVTATDFFAT